VPDEFAFVLLPLILAEYDYSLRFPTAAMMLRAHESTAVRLSTTTSVSTSYNSLPMKNGPPEDRTEIIAPPQLDTFFSDWGKFLLAIRLDGYPTRLPEMTLRACPASQAAYQFLP